MVEVMNAGQYLMEKIIEGGLFHSSCPASPGSPCLTVWSSGAAEQLEALFIEMTTSVVRKQQNVVAFTPDGEHVIAELHCGHTYRFHKNNMVSFSIPCPVCPGRKKV